MKIEKGTILKVKSDRSGSWVGKAMEDFDTEKDKFYPIALFQDEPVHGLNTVWEKGDEMPCRNTLCKIVVDKNQSETT